MRTYRKIIAVFGLATVVAVMCGCTQTGNIPQDTKSPLGQQETKEAYEPSEVTGTIGVDFTRDYSQDIQSDVEYVVSNSVSLQEELKSIEKISEKYAPLAKEAQTQGEMNLASRWFHVIWDTELSSLCDRLSSFADQQASQKILAEQENWAVLKDKVTELAVGTMEENGSMYPLLVNSFMEEITKNRAYLLASELAGLKGEAFDMPESSQKYGLFVDNQETDDIYSSLVTRQGIDGSDESVISIYRQGETEGTFVDNGNGKLEFTSNDGSVKGIIEIHGWDGATFEVTEVSEASPFSVGQIVHFPLAF